jgi:hypothetical protein
MLRRGMIQAKGFEAFHDSLSSLKTILFQTSDIMNTSLIHIRTMAMPFGLFALPRERGLCESRQPHLDAIHYVKKGE